MSHCFSVRADLRTGVERRNFLISTWTGEYYCLQRDWEESIVEVGNTGCVFLSWLLSVSRLLLFENWVVIGPTITYEGVVLHFGLCFD
jgi:hypothetical protein